MALRWSSRVLSWSIFLASVAYCVSMTACWVRMSFQRRLVTRKGAADAEHDDGEEGQGKEPGALLGLARDVVLGQEAAGRGL
jgi:hypothetical protein